ncbi:hypothetical protein [Agrobacterium tumefaciens]|nr:hypothetical protein [Agrobacterium tumefaciens]
MEENNQPIPIIEFIKALARWQAATDEAEEKAHWKPAAKRSGKSE